MAQAVAVGRVEAAVNAQVSQFKSNVVRFTRATLNDGGKKIRRRMIRERLSGMKYPRNRAPAGAPLARKRGTLQKSLRYRTRDQGDVVTLDTSIGGGEAYYADRWEDEGRLQFRRVVQEEMVHIQDALRTGFAFLARNPGKPGVLTPGIAGTGIEDFFAERDKATFFASRRLTNRGGRGRRAKAGANSFQADFKRGFWDREGLIPRSGLLERGGL